MILVNRQPYTFQSKTINFTNFTFFLSFQDVADALGYKTNGSDSLWKDRANVELTSAVLDSYKKAGVTIVDHHTLVSNILFVISNHQFTNSPNYEFF